MTNHTIAISRFEDLFKVMPIQEILELAAHKRLRKSHRLPKSNSFYSIVKVFGKFLGKSGSNPLFSLPWNSP